MSDADIEPGGLDERVWERGWEDHDQRQLERLARLSLPEKLAWLEEAHRLAQQLRNEAQPDRTEQTKAPRRPSPYKP